MGAILLNRLAKTEMTTDEKALAKAFKHAREGRIKNLDSAAVAMGMSASSLYKREAGEYSIKLIELLSLAEASGTHPITLLWDILTHCDRSVWEAAAEKLGCSPAQARDKLERGAALRKITPWQLWLKVEKDQVTL